MTDDRAFTKNLISVRLAYPVALDGLIPHQTAPHRMRARKRTIYLATRGNFAGAKYMALRLGAKEEEIIAVEMLLMGCTITPKHPNPASKHWRP